MGIPINVAHTIDSDRLSAATTASARSSARLSAKTLLPGEEAATELQKNGIHAPKGLCATLANSVAAHPLRVRRALWHTCWAHERAAAIADAAVGGDANP